MIKKQLYSEIVITVILSILVFIYIIVENSTKAASQTCNFDDGENICCGSVQAAVGACNVNGTLTQYCSSSQVPIGSSCPF